MVGEEQIHSESVWVYFCVVFEAPLFVTVFLKEREKKREKGGRKKE